MGNYSEFRRGVVLLQEELDFDQDRNVSVFETNIRVVGGLLSSHLMAKELAEKEKSVSTSRRLSVACWLLAAPCHSPLIPQSSSPTFPLSPHRSESWYKGRLLHMAVDLTQRLMPAFDTPTGKLYGPAPPYCLAPFPQPLVMSVPRPPPPIGIPYGTVNLRYGVPPGETVITSLAGGGTHLLEFALVSRLTGRHEFERAARGALRALWARRSPLHLLGNHINIQTGVTHLVPAVALM
jgi:mannosidase alpha-like ER degradation enhancer 2